MPYTPAAPGLYGQTYKQLLLEGQSEVIGAVREPGLVFERDFMVCVNEVDTTGGILVQEAGQPDLYVWKCINPEIGTVFQGLVFGFVQNQGCRLWCATGQLIFSWRERYRLGR